MAKELAKVNQETALATVPEFLKSKVGQNIGTENVDQTDMLIPRLGIAQSLSPQLKKTNELFIKGLEVGNLFNTVTNEIYPDQVVIVPLFFFKSFIHFKPIKEGGGIVAQYKTAAEVPKGGLDFIEGVNEGKPQVTEFKNWMCLLIQKGKKPEAIVASFKSSALKICRKWTSLIRMTNLPAYAKFYNVEAAHKSKGELEWESINILPGEFVPEQFFSEAEQYFNSLKAAGAEMDTRGLTEDDNGSQGDEPAGGNTGF